MGELYRIASGVADGSGNLTITFVPVPTGRVWDGTLFITNAPASSSWTGQRNGLPWPGTQAGGSGGTVVGRGGDSIALVGSGFVPGTNYIAEWSGNDYDARGVGAWSPPFPSTTH